MPSPEPESAPPARTASVVLKPLTAGEFDDYLEQRTQTAAIERARIDFLTFEDSLAFSRRQLAALLPQGIATPEHHFYRVVAGEVGAVGDAWLRVDPALRLAWLFDIQIDLPHRGKGFGRAAFTLLEDQARTLGARVLWLNVAGDNQVAQRLYLSAGLRVAAMHMNKVLD